MTSTATTKPFSLDELMSRIYTTTKIADPTEFAARVFAEIPKEHYGAALQSIMREHVCVWFSRRAMRPVRVADKADEDSTPHTADPNAVSQSSVNRRFGGQAALLRLRVCVADGYKVFSNLTPADFDFLISARRSNADREIAKAEFYERVRKAMRKHGAERFVDLPRDVIAAFDSERFSG